MIRALLFLIVLACVPRLVVAQAIVLPSGCGTASYSNGAQSLTQDNTGRLCDSSSGAITTHTAIPTPGIPASSAVLESSSIKTGCDIQNTGSVVLYISFSGTATSASIQLASGQSYHCPFPSTMGLSVYNASSVTAGTLAGDLY